MNESTTKALSASVVSPYALWPMLAVGIVAISLASILIRLAEAPALTIAAYRVTLASLAIGPLFVHKHYTGAHAWTVKVFLFTSLSGFFLAFHFVFWIYSLKMTSVASSVTLVSTTPLFVAVFSYLWLRERPTRRLVMGILLTLAGSVLVAGNDIAFSKGAIQGDCLAILGAVMAAGYLLVGRFVRRTLGLSAYSFGAYGAATVVLLLCCLFAGIPLSGFSDKTYVALALLALVPQLIGHTTFNWTLKFLSPTTVAILILGEPIGATFLAYFIFGETVTGIKAVGLGVLGAGIALSAQSVPRTGEE